MRQEAVGSGRRQQELRLRHVLHINWDPKVETNYVACALLYIHIYRIDHIVENVQSLDIEPICVWYYVGTCADCQVVGSIMPFLCRSGGGGMYLA